MNVPFEKFSSCGNNFIVVDERLKNHIPEHEKGDFARQVTDGNFGIGADGFIVLQPCTPQTLLEINNNWHYWKQVPVNNGVDYIFRMFEPTGQESLCCGNGLLCLAEYVHQTSGITACNILTEIPGTQPAIRTLGYDVDKKQVWVNMGTPGKIPIHLAHPEGVMITPSELHGARFEIPLHKLPGICPPVNQERLSFTGYLVFSGEPHLVIVLDAGNDHDPCDPVTGLSDILEQTAFTFEADPFHAIGRYFNNRLMDIFPLGINVNIVKITETTRVVEQRCFERGIEKETLACGTGMVASAYTLHALGMIQSDTTFIHPLKCRSYRPETCVCIERRHARYVMYGKPVWICTGMFRQEERQNGFSSFPQRKKMGVEI